MCVCPVGRNALHVDVHMPSGFIYWCDFSSTVASQNGIRRIKPDGSGFRSIVTSGIGRNGIRGIAVDWAAGEGLCACCMFRFGDHFSGHTIVTFWLKQIWPHPKTSKVLKGMWTLMPSTSETLNSWSVMWSHCFHVVYTVLECSRAALEVRMVTALL